MTDFDSNGNLARLRFFGPNLKQYLRPQDFEFLQRTSSGREVIDLSQNHIGAYAESICDLLEILLGIQAEPEGLRLSIPDTISRITHSMGSPYLLTPSELFQWTKGTKIQLPFLS
jgi:hypothetical protein